MVNMFTKQISWRVVFCKKFKIKKTKKINKSYNSKNK